jgi:hypothetical protein
MDLLSERTQMPIVNTLGINGSLWSASGPMFRHLDWPYIGCIHLLPLAIAHLSFIVLPTILNNAFSPPTRASHQSHNIA